MFNKIIKANTLLSRVFITKLAIQPSKCISTTVFGMNRIEINKNITVLGNNYCTYRFMSEQTNDFSKLFLSAKTNIKEGNLSESIKQLEEALKLAKTDTEKLECYTGIGGSYLASVYLLLYYYYQNNNEKAVENFEKALKFAESREDKIMCNLYLGRSYFNLGKGEKAILNFQEMLKLSNSEKEKMICNYKIGIYYHSSGQYEKAIPYLLEVVKTNPVSEEGYFSNLYLGICYHNTV